MGWRVIFGSRTCRAACCKIIIKKSIYKKPTAMIEREISKLLED